mgnify:CR=1 FL=1
MKFLKTPLIFVMLISLISCATSMSPLEVNNTLPSLTKSKFLSHKESEEAVNTGKCKYITKQRSYTAPVGLTTKNDLKNAARGIDEWVELDGGNSYILRNYKWVTVDQSGSTQLHVEFDTMLCE